MTKERSRIEQKNHAEVKFLRKEERNARDDRVGSLKIRSGPQESSQSVVDLSEVNFKPLACMKYSGLGEITEEFGLVSIIVAKEVQVHFFFAVIPRMFIMCFISFFVQQIAKLPTS